ASSAAAPAPRSAASTPSSTGPPARSTSSAGPVDASAPAARPGTSDTLVGMITLTDTAAAKVKSLIDEEGEAALALRVAVRPGGCSGFSYEMFFDTDVADDDKVLTYGDVRVLVDSSSAVMLEGATLDFKDGLE